jgi:hypothetical protein
VLFDCRNGGVSMRVKISYPKYMTAEEIQTNYMGKWVFISNAEMSDTMDFIGGTPQIVADEIYEGHEDGFYNEFLNNDKYSPCLDMDYMDSSLFLANAFFSEVAYAN